MSDNTPAFPCEAQGNRSVPPEKDYLQVGIHAAKFPGMTKREYFASCAMQGLLSDSAATLPLPYADIPAMAVCMADTLIAELKK